MKEKPQKKKTVMINARARAVARNFYGRICRQGSRIYIVDGKPDPEKLFNYMAALKEVPSKVKEPTPYELGFTGSDVRELMPEELNDWNQALVRWQTTIHQMSARKRQKREEKEKVERWRKEVEHLEKRKNIVYKLYHRAVNENSTSVQWIPADVYEINIDALFQEAAPGKILSPLWKWLAVICGWVGGRESARRFLEVITPVCGTDYEIKRQNAVKLIHRRLSELQSLMEEYERQAIYNRIEALLGSISPGILADINIKHPGRMRDIGEYITAYIKKMEMILRALPKSDYSNIAALAVIAAVDGADAPLPKMLLYANYSNHKEIISDLLKNSSHPQYGMLLKTLNQIKSSPREPFYDQLYGQIMELHTAGASPEDIAWLYDYGRSQFDIFANKKLSPHSVRSSVLLLKQFGAECTEDEIEHLLTQTAASGHTSIVDIFFKWLSKVPKRYWKTGKAQTAWNTLLSSASLGRTEFSHPSVMYRWAFPRKPRTTVTLPTKLSQESREIINVVIAYQNMLGQSDSLPSSLSRLLTVRESRSEELRELLKRQAAGELNPSAEKRLRNLQRDRQSVDDIAINDDKIQRQAEELASIFALEALRKLTQEKLIEYFKEEFGGRSPAWLKLHELIELVEWSAKLNEPAREKLDEIVSVWLREGDKSKSRLSANKQWLKNAVQKGVTIDRWLNPGVKEILIKNRKVKIGFTGWPFRVFLMGSYFDTCLSINSKVYTHGKESVLSNAYDANKQVIFAVDQNDRVLARKLIAINSNWRLVGYRTYISDSSIVEDLRKYIDEFCYTLSYEVGVNIGSSGKPVSISELNWYDDGIEAFDSVKETVEESKSEGNNPNVIPADTEVVRAAYTYKKDCIALLDRIGIWPPEEGTEIDQLVSTCPALIEETLAFVAREKQDAELAKLLARCNRTETGTLEAVLANYVVNGAEIPTSVVRRLGRVCRRYYDTVAATDTKASARILAYECLQSDYYGNKFSLFSLLQKSAQAAYYIKEFLVGENIWYAPAVLDLFIMVSLLRRHTGTISDNLIHKIFTHYHQTDVEQEHSYDDTKLPLSQWLSIYNKPNNYLSVKMLQECYNNETMLEIFPETHRNTQVGVIMWAMRNQCAASTTFLRKNAESDPAALLALSLIKPGRFKKVIYDLALGYLTHPAAMLALYNIYGEEKAKEVLVQQKFHNYEKTPVSIDCIADIYRHCSIYEWLPVMVRFNQLSNSHKLTCLPFIIWKMHEALDSMVDGNLAGIQPGESTDVIRRFGDTGFDIRGLCILLAERLRQVKDPDKQLLLRRSIHLLLFEKFFDGTDRLWINMLSGDRLYYNLEDEFVTKDLMFFDILTNPYDLFFDNSGNPRMTTNLEWQRDEYLLPVNLPDDLHHARLYADFVMKKYQGDLNTDTEIHRRVLKSARERLKAGESIDRNENNNQKSIHW